MTAWTFTQVEIILQKRCQWCQWQISGIPGYTLSCRRALCTTLQCSAGFPAGAETVWPSSCSRPALAIFASHPIHPSALSSSLSLSLSLSHHWLWDLRLPIYCIVYKIYFWQYKLTKKIDGCESQGSKWKDATHVKRHWVKKVAYCDAQFWARN